MNEASQINKGILVSDKILIFSLFVGYFCRKGQALTFYISMFQTHQ